MSIAVLARYRGVIQERGHLRQKAEDEGEEAKGRDLGDAVSHGLEPLKVRPESLIPPALDGFEVPWLRWFVLEGLKVSGEASTEVAPVVDVVSG